MDTLIIRKLAQLLENERLNPLPMRLDSVVCCLLLGCAAIASTEAEAGSQISGLSVAHRQGQTFITWQEVAAPQISPRIRLERLRKKKERASRGSVKYRVYRSHERIEDVKSLAPLAEVAPLSAWNHKRRGIRPPAHALAQRFVIEDGREPLSPGQGLYVHNPQRAGSAFYAVTIVRSGKEDRRLSSANRTQAPVQETVGPGVPVLQREETGERFFGVEEVTLLHYTRWEAPPRSNHIIIPPPKGRGLLISVAFYMFHGSNNGF